MIIQIIARNPPFEMVHAVKTSVESDILSDLNSGFQTEGVICSLAH